MVVIAIAHPWFEHRNIIGVTTFGTMGFSAITITYLCFGNPPHFVIYSWFFYLVATVMMTPLITNKIFFIMEGYQLAFIVAMMVWTRQSEEEIAVVISLAVPLLGYVYAVTWLGRKNGLEAYENAKQNHFLVALDGLSNLLNRRAWYECSNRLVNENTPISFMMLDIDHFKKINDTYGHDCGDEVIKIVSKILLEETREYDIVGRLGGEEFGIILPQTTLQDAYSIAERIRERVATLNVTYKEYTIPVSISIGVSERDNESVTLNALVIQGDECLYRAKSEGRNRVIAYHH